MLLAKLASIWCRTGVVASWQIEFGLEGKPGTQRQTTVVSMNVVIVSQPTTPREPVRSHPAAWGAPSTL